MVMNLENIDFNNSEQRLNSPRSIEACKLIGVEENELFYLDFQAFKESNPEVRVLKRELQNLRFEHYEKLRQDTIAAVKAERNKLIEKEQNSKELSEPQVSKIVTVLFLEQVKILKQLGDN